MTSSVVESPGTLTILAVATEWESRHGGISTFNRELCSALSSLGHEVFCLIPTCAHHEFEAAASAGVTLIAPPRDETLSDEMRLSTFRSLPGNRSADVILGHGRPTGSIAKALAANYPASRRIQFVHVAPGAIEWFKDHSLPATDRAEYRERVEISLCRTATLAAAVGPLLFREVGILLGGTAGALYEFRPGITEVASPLTRPAGIQCLLLGRGEDERLKGLDIAARAFALLDQEWRPRPILMVRGAPPGAGDGLRAQLLAVAGTSRPDIRVRSFSADAARIAEDLAQSSLLLMPSRSEGFGLVGLEGIATGIPVLLSDRSGLAEMLRDLVPDQADFSIVSVSGDLEVDGPVWARRIDRVLRDRATAFRRAEHLRAALAPLLSWRASACELLRALREAEAEPAKLGAPSTHSGTIHATGQRALSLVPSIARAVRIADLSTVRSWGWTDVEMQTELYRLDYETMADLTDEHSGLAEQWAPVFSEHPESWRLLYAEPGKLVGYWHFVALFADQYSEARAGTLLDAQITGDRVRSFELPGVYDIYFAGVCIRGEWRRPAATRVLLHSVLDVFERLAAEGIFIREVCANAFTLGGVSFCKSLGMVRCATHAHHGEVYVGRLVDLLDQPIAEPFDKLRSVYRSAMRQERSA